MGRSVYRKEGTNKYQYKNLQKVYSIWIVNNCSRKTANTISHYGITHRPLYGEIEDHDRWDLLNVVMIRLPDEKQSDKAVNKPSQLHSMLSTVFSGTLSAAERLHRLENDFGIKVTEKIRREVTDMCNLSYGIRENAIDENKREVAERMIKGGKLSDEDIAEYSGLTVEQVQEIKDDMFVTV